MRSCPRCQRTNPADALFCYFDGTNLDVPAEVIAARADNRLPHEFVFASGRRCKTYDDLVLACQEEWASASEALQEGVFRQFLAGLGRLDLAKAADALRQQTDPDLALDSFLAILPAREIKKPRLELEPRRIQLGTLRTGETSSARLLVINQGHGLLTGTISVTKGNDWLRIVGADGLAILPIKAVREQVVQLEVDARGLIAPQKYGASLSVVTSGGIVEVAVRLIVTALPYPTGPFQGACTPRELAVRMRSNPKAAVPLLENGDIARWFESNRWGYPVQGATASGMASVQQFFEAMGLAKPPRVQARETEAHYTCLVPETVAGQVVVQSPERKWVYAHAHSEELWLQVKTPVVSGAQQCAVQYLVDSSVLDPGRNYAGVLHVVANGGQNVSVRVNVDVEQPATRARTTQPARAIATLPMGEAGWQPARRAPEAVPDMPDAPMAEAAPAVAGFFRPLLIGALAGCVVRLLVALAADLYARWWSAPPGGNAGSFAYWLEAPTDVAFVQHFTLATWWLGAVIGAAVLGRRGSTWADVPCGLIAGAAAGVAGAATFACFLPLLDAPARVAFAAFGQALGPGRATLSTLTTTSLWLFVVVSCWAFLGAVLGVVLDHAKKRD
jgi:hypothetical protein